MNYEHYTNELIAEAKRSNIVPFIGAGLSIPCGGYSWNDLTSDLLSQLRDPFNTLSVLNKLQTSTNLGNLHQLDIDIITNSLIGSLDPLQISQMYQNHYGRNALLKVITDLTNKIGSPNKTHKLLTDIGSKIFVTTNYDNLLEDALNTYQTRPNLIINERDAAYVNNDELIVVKMHGSLQDKDTIVISSEDYENYDLKHPVMSLLLQYFFSMKTILLIGYSGKDPNFNFLFNRVKAYFGKHKRFAYFILFDANNDILDYYHNSGLYPINLDGKNKTQSITDWLDEFKRRI